MPRIVFVPARGWKREYPTDIATYADGTTGDPSLTSERFWQECERSLSHLIAHLQRAALGRARLRLPSGARRMVPARRSRATTAASPTGTPSATGCAKSTRIIWSPCAPPGTMAMCSSIPPRSRRCPRKPNPQRAFFEAAPRTQRHRLLRVHVGKHRTAADRSGQSRQEGGRTSGARLRLLRLHVRVRTRLQRASGARHATAPRRTST